jgi:hypothetical protein
VMPILCSSEHLLNTTKKASFESIALPRKEKRECEPKALPLFGYYL